MPFRFNPQVENVTGEIASRVTNLRRETRAAIRSIVLSAFRERVGKPERDIRALLTDVSGLTTPAARSVDLYRRRMMEMGLSPEVVERRTRRYSRRKIRERASTIARTEVQTVLNDGQELAWQQASDQDYFLQREMEKVVIVTPDELLCPICGPMKGERAEIGKPFSRPGPPFHPNCRCTHGLRRKRDLMEELPDHWDAESGFGRDEQIGIGNVSTSDVRNTKIVQDAIAALPPGIRALAHNAHISIVRKIKLKALPPGAAPIGGGVATEGAALGVMRTQTGRIEIASQYTLRGKTYAAKGLDATVVHELGHFIDWRVGHQLSQGYAYTFRAEAMLAGKAEQSALRHYLSSDKEAFAEVFAHVYGKSDKSGWIGRKKFEKLFPKSIEEMKHRMTGFRPIEALTGPADFVSSYPSGKFPWQDYRAPGPLAPTGISMWEQSRVKAKVKAKPKTLQTRPNLGPVIKRGVHKGLRWNRDAKEWGRWSRKNKEWVKAP